MFRAKVKNSDEYVSGYFSKDGNDGYYIMISSECYYETFDTADGTYRGITCSNSYEIDPSTLAINFPDMLDSQGNKIFASLNEDGKGGDICYVKDFSYGDLQGVARYEDYLFRIHRKGKSMGVSLKCRDIKTIGIKQ